jgi:hypothetical protein
MKAKHVVAVAMGALVLGFAGGAWAAKGKEMQLVTTGEVQWMPIDPKAGTAGPMMSVVFGDMKKKAPLGMLLKVTPGGSPGPHIHTSDYWGVMITGTEHNFLSGATDKGKGLGPGSWWMQPGKMGHDNHCEPGTECTMFLYFPKGFDMMPDPKAAASVTPTEKKG